MKKTGQRLCSLTLALTLCLGLCISVSAKQAAIQYNTEPTSIGGISQLKEKYSSLYVGEDSSAWASAWLRDKAGNTLSAGSLGVEARLYNKDGELCASTGMRYNTKPASFVSAVTTVSSEGYCSFGHIRTIYFKDFDSFRVENDKRLTAGDDFTYLPESNSYKFPDKLLAVLKENENGYPVNSLGETYGSALLVGYNDNYTMPPVLLSAVGSNGVHGYVREADLSPYLATRKDAVAYMSKLEKNRILPLYDRDGNVIGTFVLDGSFTSGTTTKELESAQAAAAAKPGAQTSQSVKLPTAKVELAKLAKRSQDNCPYQRNSKGETYGSSAAVGNVGYAPAWVTVVSTDGDQGVVQAKDFFLAKPGVLPVYDLEGKVIGEFLIEEFVPPSEYKPGMSMEEVKALVKDG
ncbi:hypothetical protein [Oscillibacter sp. CU971]|uniref:hypothetical protein n=1 Tax=Oscillibacter sp. CU971 TaxID=2780102 RepID=UPI00195E0538|nr:hypothetical protein [Oscillibacter sp. CU971]